MFNQNHQKSNIIKTFDEINKIKEAGKIVSKIKLAIGKIIAPGVLPLELEELAQQIIEEENAKSSTLNYHGFPSVICFSKNEVLVHGIPNAIPLVEGDIVSIDISINKDGYHADSAFTIGVGKISELDQKLIKITKEALELGINLAKPGVRVNQIGKEIEAFVKANGFEVCKDFVGHGIGKMLHEDPSIPNFYDKHNNFILEENMTICIEPMLMIDSNKTFIDPLDGWTVRSKNGKNTSHEEHTILVTINGGKILTKI